MDLSYGAVNSPGELGDGVTRKVPLFLNFEGNLYPGLAMQSLINGLDIGEDQIRIELGKEVTIFDTPRGTLRIPIDGKARMRVNFTGTLGDFVPAYSYQDLIDASGDEDLLKADIEGKFVVVGTVATGSTDMVATPLGRMPGMVVHALALGHILDGSHLTVWPGWKTALLCAGLAFVCYGILGWIRHRILLPLIPVALAIGLVYWAFRQAERDVLIPLTAPLSTIFFSTFWILCGSIWIERKARYRISNSFKPYIAAPLHKRILSIPTKAHITSRREGTLDLFLGYPWIHQMGRRGRSRGNRRGFEPVFLTRDPHCRKARRHPR